MVVFGIGEGDAVEAVFIPRMDVAPCAFRAQAGCAVSCRFCATGHQRFSRNLSAGEVVSQLWLQNIFCANIWPLMIASFRMLS